MNKKDTILILHKMVKELLDKDVSFEAGDYDEDFDEEGSVSVTNSLNDKKPKYYLDILEETADKLASLRQKELCN